MITTADVRDFLKSFDIGSHFYIGKLDNKPDEAIGVYSLRGSGAPVTAIGGESSYDIIGVSVLVHWNRNAKETEDAARRLYEQLRTVRDVSIKNHAVYLIELLVPEPVDVGTDDKGVYERVTELKIWYERK